MKFDGKHYIAHRQWDVTQQFVRADRAGIPAATWEPSSELSGMVYHKIPYEIPQVCTYIYIYMIIHVYIGMRSITIVYHVEIPYIYIAIVYLAKYFYIHLM